MITIDELRDEFRKLVFPEWDFEWLDYVTQFNLSRENTPDLISLMRDNLITDNDFISLHAWRSLAQLGAIEAIPEILATADKLEKEDDDIYLGDFPQIFAIFGPAAIPFLDKYLSDDSHLHFPRISMIDSLEEMAKAHPQVRDEVISVLTGHLERFSQNDPELNGFFIGSLVELKGVESAELIERAFAADKVNVDHYGNWNMVKNLLGVEGLGLVPEELANKMLHAGWGNFREGYDLAPYKKVSGSPRMEVSKKSRRKERKRQRQNRKRNRR